MKPAGPLLMVLLLLALATPTASAQQDGAATHEITLYLHDEPTFHVSPELLRVDVGDTLEITVINDSNTSAQHDLLFCGDGRDADTACDDPWVATPLLQPDQEFNLTLTVDQAGTFDYYCTIVGHKAAGMRGELQVLANGNDEPGGKSSAPWFVLGLVGALGAAALAHGRRRANE